MSHSDFGVVREAGRKLVSTALVLTTGCASVLPPETSTVRNVVRSESIVQAQRPMGVRLKGSVLWVTPDRLSVSIDQITGCDDGYRDTVQTTRVVSRETKGLGTEVGVGAALAGLGGIGLVVAPGLSDQASGSDASPQDTAITWGAIGLATGAIILGHAVYIAAKGADDVSEPDTTIERRSAGRPLRACGTTAAGAGRIVAEVADRSTEITTVQGGSGILIEPRAAATRLCGDPADINKVATLRYFSANNDNLNVVLDKYPLRRCVVATVARKKFAAADSALSNAKDTPTLIWAFQSLDDATAGARSLPTTDPERAELLLTATRLSGLAVNRAKVLTAPLVDEATQAIDVNVLTSAQSVAKAMRVARLADDGAARWKQLYGRFVARAKERGVAGYAATQELLVADGQTRGCLFGVDGCAPSEREEARRTLSPVSDAAATSVEKQATELRAATAALAKQVNTKAVQRCDRALENARDVRKVCAQGDLLSPMDAQCAAFTAADSNLSAELTTHATRVAEIRAASAQDERRRTTERAAKAWRTHFGECRRLISAIQQLQGLSSCDAACQQVRTRMVAERARLANFHVDDPIDDSKLRETLSSECGKAGCEACP